MPKFMAKMSKDYGNFLRIFYYSAKNTIRGDREKKKYRNIGIFLEKMSDISNILSDISNFLSDIIKLFVWHNKTVVV